MVVLVPGLVRARGRGTALRLFDGLVARQMQIKARASQTCGVTASIVLPQPLSPAFA